MNMSRNRLSFMVMASCLGLLAAIAWQGLYGHRNFEFQKGLSDKASQAQSALADVTIKRVAIETRVGLLRPGSIDADLVDEIARRDLNMGSKSDFIARVAN